LSFRRAGCIAVLPPSSRPWVIDVRDNLAALGRIYTTFWNGERMISKMLTRSTAWGLPLHPCAAACGKLKNTVRRTVFLSGR